MIVGPPPPGGWNYPVRRNPSREAMRALRYSFFLGIKILPPCRPGPKDFLPEKSIGFSLFCAPAAPKFPQILQSVLIPEISALSKKCPHFRSSNRQDKYRKTLLRSATWSPRVTLSFESASCSKGPFTYYVIKILGSWTPPPPPPSTKF